MDDPSGQVGWAPPAPRELPALRARLVDHVRSPAAHAAARDALRAGAGALSPRTGDVDRDAQVLLAEEHARLEAAELHDE